MTIPNFQITMDCEDKTCPVQRLTLHVFGLARNDAVLFAEDYTLKLGYKYKIAYIIAGFKEA